RACSPQTNAGLCRPGLAPDARHVGVAVAGGGTARKRLVEPRQLLVRELDVRGGGILLEIAPPLRARNGDDVLAARQHPRERELRGRDALLRGELADVLRQPPVPLEVGAGEAGMALAEVALVELLRRAEAAREEAAAERAVGD